MNYYKFMGEFLSSDGKRNITYYIYEPKCEIKGIVQISHGMCEYIERYEEFADFLTKNGWLVCGNDHLGHGRSVLSEEELGYFSEEDGWEHCVNDLNTTRRIIRQKYIDNLPYVLLGHSMGSFIARAYLIKYPSKIDSAIICGTSAGFPKSIGTQLFIVDKIKKAEGEKHRSKRINNLMFGNYNRRIENSASPFDWVCSRKEIVEKYGQDKWCNFTFTVNGFENLVKVLAYVTVDKWYDSVKKDLPIFLVAGDGDPVGSYGHGVYKVFQRLSKRGCNVRMKLYSGMRHEILNEENRIEPYKDILAFLELTAQSKENNNVCKD